MCQKKPGFACRVVEAKLYNRGARRCEVLHSTCGCNVSFSPVDAAAMTSIHRLQSQTENPLPFLVQQCSTSSLTRLQNSRELNNWDFWEEEEEENNNNKKKNFGKKSILGPNGFYNPNPPRHFNADLCTSLP